MKITNQLIHDGFMAIHHAYVMKTFKDEEPNTLKEVVQKREWYKPWKKSLQHSIKKRYGSFVLFPKVNTPFDVNRFIKSKEIMMEL